MKIKKFNLLFPIAALRQNAAAAICRTLYSSCRDQKLIFVNSGWGDTGKNPSLSAFSAFGSPHGKTDT